MDPSGEVPIPPVMGRYYLPTDLINAEDAVIVDKHIKAKGMQQRLDDLHKALPRLYEHWGEALELNA